MPNTYTLIASSTVGSGGASYVEFTSIPATYTDLLVKCSLRSNRADGTVIDAVALRFNGNSSASYNFTRLTGTGAAASSASGSGDTSLFLDNPSSNSATASTFGNSEYYIPNYAGSTNKSVSADAVSENNGTTAYARLTAGLWSNTSAITSIRLTPDTGTLWNQYSTATLYGIKNS
jgi:hypothetical protein